MTWWQIVLVSLGGLFAYVAVGSSTVHYFHHVWGDEVDLEKDAWPLLFAILWPLLLLAAPWVLGKLAGKRIAREPAKVREALKRLEVKK